MFAHECCVERLAHLAEGQFLAQNTTKASRSLRAAGPLHAPSAVRGSKPMKHVSSRLSPIAGSALTIVLTAAAVNFVVSPRAFADTKDTEKRLELAATVFTEIMGAPDKGIPDDLL